MGGGAKDLSILTKNLKYVDKRLRFEKRFSNSTKDFKYRQKISTKIDIHHQTRVSSLEDSSVMDILKKRKNFLGGFFTFKLLTFIYFQLGTVGRFDNDVDDGSARKVAEGDGRESMARLGRLQKVDDDGSEGCRRLRKVAEG